MQITPTIAAIDSVLQDTRWAPRWGWHDDHRHNDRKPEYLPAMQQVREEVAELIGVLAAHEVLGGSCLQLGMGECDASHAVWRALFDTVVTMDYRVYAVGAVTYPGANIRSYEAWQRAALWGRPYDFLFVDAGHSVDEVKADHLEYALMVRPGGIIAFHDAVKRPTYEDEIQVWRYLDELRAKGVEVNMIGEEIGIAWIVKG